MSFDYQQHTGRHHRNDTVRAAAESVASLAAQQKRLLEEASPNTRDALARHMAMIQDELLTTYDELHVLDARHYRDHREPYSQAQMASSQMPREQSGVFDGQTPSRWCDSRSVIIDVDSEAPHSSTSFTSDADGTGTTHDRKTSKARNMVRALISKITPSRWRGNQTEQDAS